MKSNKTKEELEKMCEDLNFRVVKMKDNLRLISKCLQSTIRENWRKGDEE